MSNYKNYDERFTFEGGSGGGTTVKNIECYIDESLMAGGVLNLYANPEFTEYLNPEEVVAAFESGGNIHGLKIIESTGDDGAAYKEYTNKELDITRLACHKNVLSNKIIQLSLYAYDYTYSSEISFECVIVIPEDSEEDQGGGGSEASNPSISM